MYNERKNISLLLFLLFFTSCGIFKPSDYDLSKNRTRSKTRTSVVKTRTPKPKIETPTKEKVASNKASAISNLRSNIVEEAKKYVGIPYQYGGKKPNGFDCSGLTSYVLKKNKISIADGSFNQAKQGRRVALSQTKAGDLVFFGRNGKVNHVAMVLSNQRNTINVIHSTSGKGVLVEDILASSYWKQRLLYARNVIEP